MDYEKQYHEYLARVNRALEAACNTYLPEESEVCRAARYSLMSGGKRIRAVLVLSVCDMLHGNAEAAEQFAAAVEMLHCYSLIHDDLPCMDNDDLRRGKPSCHKAFGEATAMLAGDVLLTEAFNAIAHAPASAEIRVRAAQALGMGDLIETVQKLRSEMSTKFIHDRFLTSRIDITILINALQQMC